MIRLRYIDLSEKTNPEDVDLSSFELKDELNQQFWGTGKLDPRARLELLTICRDFLEDLEIKDIELEDIIFTGSLANYNWSEEYSDIDLHIVVDFESVADDIALVKKYFDSVRKVWNDTHTDIRIYGYPVELYVQASDEPHNSSGVYSILNNDWIRKPSRKTIENKGLKKEDVKKDAAYFMTEIDDLIDSESEMKPEELYDKAKSLFDEIKETRKKSMSGMKGEMVEGNLVFKTLRRNGYIEKLLDFRTKCYDESRSVK